MFDALIDKFAVRSPRAAAPLLWLRKHRKTRRALFIAFFHLLGALTSIHAILGVRTSQGAIAWAVSLNTFPYVAVPAYWVFGRSNFEGYVVLAAQGHRRRLSDAERQVARDLLAMRPAPEAEPASATLLEKLAKTPGDARQSHRAAHRRRGDLSRDLREHRAGARIRARAVLHHPRRRRSDGG